MKLCHFCKRAIKDCHVNTIEVPVLIQDTPHRLKKTVILYFHLHCHTEWWQQMTDDKRQLGLF